MSQLDSKPTNPWLLLAVIVSAGAIARAYNSFDYDFHYDTYSIFGAVTADTLENFWWIVRSQAHPPLFYIIVRSLLPLSQSVVMLKFVSLAFGIVAIYAGYYLGRELKNTTTGVIVAIIYAFSKGLIIESQTGRQYSLFVILVTLTLILFLKVMSAPSRKMLAAYAISLLLLALSNFASAIIILGLFLTTFVCFFAKQFYKRYLWIQIIHVALGITAFLLIQLSKKGGPIGGKPYFKYLSAHFVHSLEDFFTKTAAVFEYLFLPGSYGLPFILLSLLGAVYVFRTTKSFFPILSFCTLFVTVGLAAFDAYPYVGKRHCLFLLPFWAPHVAISIQLLRFRANKHVISLVAVVAIVLTGHALSNNSWRNNHTNFRILVREVREVTDFISMNKAASDLIHGPDPSILRIKPMNTEKWLSKTNSGRRYRIWKDGEVFYSTALPSSVKIELKALEEDLRKILSRFKPNETQGIWIVRFGQRPKGTKKLYDRIKRQGLEQASVQNDSGFAFRVSVKDLLSVI